MMTCLHRAAWFAVLPFCLGISATHAQTNSVQTARFGTIEIDQSHAQGWGDFIDNKELKKQIADLQGALVYREGALGFYRVGFEAVGDRVNGKVRVTVTIVGQNGDQTILANSQSTQRWQNGVFLYEEPQPISPRETGNNNPAQIPAPTDGANFYPTRFNSSFAQAVAEFCKSREEKTGHDDGKKSRNDESKREEKRAPNPEPKRQEKSEPKRAPDPKPEPRREEPKREEPKRAPDPRPEPKREERPRRDERPEWERKTKPRREDNAPPAPPQIETPRAPEPQPKVEPEKVEPKRAPNPEPPRVRRPESPRPNPPTATLPPIVSAPNPAPPPRGNTTAPDPNPPSTRTVPLTPNPNPPNRGGVHQESRPPRRPVWDGPYGRYPYPYPGSYPYPYPYPVPYPSPYPVPYPAPLTNADDGARQAFEFAMIAARAEAQADFDRQLTGETAPENGW